MAGSFIQAVGQALKQKGGWDDISKITGNKQNAEQDAEIKKRLRLVRTAVLDEHYRLLSRPYYPSRIASKPGQYPKTREYKYGDGGKLRGFISGTIQPPKKGIRNIRFEYFPEVNNKRFRYDDFLFDPDKGNRKGIYNVILKLKSKINRIMGTTNGGEGIEAIKF